MNIKGYIGTIILLMLAITACNNVKQQEHPTITVTIEPLRYFTQAIAGDLFEVETMVPKGSNPETYDPTPQQMVQLNNSIAYIEIGSLGFEQQWISKLQSNVPNLHFYNASEGIKYIHTDGHTCNNHIGNDNSVDPHVWMSTKNAAIIAENIYKILAKISPTNQQDLKERYDLLKQNISNTNHEIDSLLQSNTPEKAFLIYHPTLTYYAQEYGFKQIAIEKDGKEPTPSYLKQLLDDCQQLQIKTIFIQPEFDQRNAALIAKQTNTQMVEINPLSFDWHQEMIRITKALIRP